MSGKCKPGTCKNCKGNNLKFNKDKKNKYICKDCGYIGNIEDWEIKYKEAIK